MDIEEIVELSVKHNVSDLHLCSGHPPRWRQLGKLQPAPFECPDIIALINAYLSEVQQCQWQEQGQVDFAMITTRGRRLRAAAFLRHGGVSLVLRLLPEHCPQPKELDVPAVLAGTLGHETGLILVTGATGSGKSTTLASMVSHLNQYFDGHIVTLEDPIEYVHTSGRCLIQQREIGRDCSSFAAGLRGALREDPDVILLGELRDNETIRLALTAAETGHLVLATLHTRGAAEAVERLVDAFPAQEKAAVRTQLASSLRAVLAQKLETDKQGGRVALFEVMVNPPAVANLIRESKTHQLHGVMQTGLQAGMQTFEQSRQQRIEQGRL